MNKNNEIKCNLYGTDEYNCLDCDRCDEYFTKEEN